MSLKNTSVAVVGAGIGGVTSAIAFARRGAGVTMHEQAPVAEEVGGGLQLSPNAVRVIDALGLGERLRAIATRPEAGIFRDWRRGSEIARLRFGEVAEQRYGAPYMQVHRADLLALLLDEADKAGVSLKLNSRIEAPDNLPDADVIVGADGIKSAMRPHVAGPSEPRYTGQAAWRGLVPADRLPADVLPQAVCSFWGPHRHLVVYPLRDGTLWNVVAAERRKEWVEEGWRASSSVEDVRRAFAGWCRPVSLLLEAMDETFLWGLFDRPPLPCWQKDNVALLGDACHAMLPYMAQGAAMAIEDAWVLAACCEDLPVEQALPRYEELRKPRATRVQSGASGNTGIYHEARPVIRQIKHFAVRRAAARPGGLLARYDWLYSEDVTALTP